MLRPYIKHEIGQLFAPTRSRRLQKSWLEECKFITAFAHLDFHDGMSLKMIVLTTGKQFLCQSPLDGLSVVNKKKGSMANRNYQRCHQRYVYINSRRIERDREPHKRRLKVKVSFILKIHSPDAAWPDSSPAVVTLKFRKLNSTKCAKLTIPSFSTGSLDQSKSTSGDVNLSSYLKYQAVTR